MCYNLGKDVATKERLQIVLNGITQHFTRLRLCWDEAIVSMKAAILVTSRFYNFILKMVILGSDFRLLYHSIGIFDTVKRRARYEK